MFYTSQYNKNMETKVCLIEQAGTSLLRQQFDKTRKKVKFYIWQTSKIWKSKFEEKDSNFCYLRIEIFS